MNKKKGDNSVCSFSGARDTNKLKRSKVALITPIVCPSSHLLDATNFILFYFLFQNKKRKKKKLKITWCSKELGDMRNMSKEEIKYNTNKILNFCIISSPR